VVLEDRDQMARDPPYGLEDINPLQNRAARAIVKKSSQGPNRNASRIRLYHA